MRFRAQPWVPALFLVALCGVALLALNAFRNRNTWGPSSLVATLPKKDAVLLYADVAAMRRTNLLQVIAGTKSVEDLDYRRFVEETGFDYKSDLDRIAISFHEQSRYVVAAGRYDWTKIKAFALQNQAECINAICEVKSSGLENARSYYPLHNSVIAYTSSPLPAAAHSIDRSAPAEKLADPWPPEAPVWIYVPGSLWQSAGKLPSGVRIFASALASSQSTTFLIQPSLTNSQLSLLIRVQCRNEADAANIHKQLQDSTTLLRKMMERDNLKAKPESLATLLAQGTFQIENGNRVTGQWPLHMALIQAIFEGDVE